MTNFIEYHCQGESHKSSEKPCQDYAFAEASEGLSMAIVCDGHGGERYFRSQYGSQLATTITANAIREYVRNMAASYDGKEVHSVFDGSAFTSYSAALATDVQVNSEAHKSLMWLFSSIISQWNFQILQHARENDLTDWERSHVEQKYLDEFLEKKKSDTATFEKTYGCTLMAYVQTPQYWFAFHLGDGKCISMHVKDGKLVCEQPIPWDECCFLNETTSLCDSKALEEFRYCYQGDGEFPLAMCLGSDGMDDTYGDGFLLTNFYIRLLKMIIQDGKENAQNELIKSLPILSSRGSKDDMSVACVYDDSKLSEAFLLLTAYQKEQLSEQLDVAKQKILLFEQKIESAGNYNDLDRSKQIIVDYDRQKLSKAIEDVKKLDCLINSIKGEEAKYKNSLEGIQSVVQSTETDSLVELVGVESSSDN